MSNELPREVCRAILYDDEGRVLLAKRHHGQGVGQWSLVGGKVDITDISLEAAVQRETREEVGIEFQPEFFVASKPEKTETGDVWRSTYFSGRAIGRIILDAREHTEAAFYSQPELAGLDITFGHDEILRAWFQSTNAPQ